MTYNFFVIGELDSCRVAAALATLTSVGVDAVDVSDEDDQDDRNWDASVSCIYTEVRGDVNWMLDIYLTEHVREQPAESAAAAYLADSLGTAVLYAAPLALPSAYWLAAPGGLVTRARLHSVSADEDARVTYQIEAVARPVRQLPSVPVDRQPEVIREYRVPTPITSQLHTWLEAWQAAAPVPADIAERVWQARTRLAAWENLTARMAAGWPPDGWYPAKFYAEDLRTRDDLAASLELLPAAALAQFAAALDQVDANIQQQTEDDTAGVLAAVLDLSTVDLRPRDWWWHRAPNPVPWTEDAAS